MMSEKKQPTIDELREETLRAYNNWIQAGTSYGYGSRSHKVCEDEKEAAYRSLREAEQKGTTND